MRTFNISLSKSSKGTWNSIVRKIVNRKVVGITQTKGLIAHVENIKDKIFRELVASREIHKPV